MKLHETGSTRLSAPAPANHPNYRSLLPARIRHQNRWTSDVVGRYEENGRISESQQPRKCDGTHRLVSVIEAKQGRPLGLALGSRDTPEKGQEVDHLPAMFAEVAQMSGKDLLRYVEPRLPTTRGWLADLVVAEDREAPIAELTTHGGTPSLRGPNIALSCQRPLQHTFNDSLSIKVLLCQFASQPAVSLVI